MTGLNSQIITYKKSLYLINIVLRLQPPLAPIRGGAHGAQRRPGQVSRPRQGRAFQAAVLPLLKIMVDDR